MQIMKVRIYINIIKPSITRTFLTVFRCPLATKLQEISVTRKGAYFVQVSGHTMINGVSLESVKFKETVFNGHIADKMECFHGPHCTDPILFLRQVPWLWSVQKCKRKTWESDMCIEPTSPTVPLDKVKSFERKHTLEPTWHGCYALWQALGRFQ